MGRSGELSDFERGLFFGCHISKKSVRDIATLLKLAKSTIGVVIVKWKHEGTTTIKPRRGRLRLMTNRDCRAFKKVDRETHQTSSETITCESAVLWIVQPARGHRGLRGMGFHRRAAAHKPNILPVNATHHLKWCEEQHNWTTGNVWFGVMNTLYHVAIRWEGLGVANAKRTIPASMCSANCKILRRCHYSVGVFFMEWTWPSRNTVQKYKCRRIQGHSDLMHTVYGRRPVRWWQLSVSAWQYSLP
jgi:hypothetical protein